jgi:predicted RecA/RadA family phage recombinase
MKNFVQPGANVTVPAPAAVASGAGVLVGALFGVANGDAASGADVVLSTVGVFDLPKAAGAINVGAAVFWDGAAVTTTATDNTFIGYAVAAAAPGDATARVRLSV